MFLKFIFRNFNLFKAYVMIYCRKLEFKGYKMQKELEFRIELERRTESYKNGTQMRRIFRTRKNPYAKNLVTPLKNFSQIGIWLYDYAV